jgi:NAD(P)-dependent dehydrogenase (short-subunit alcohol dehydrogenase family)
MPSRARVALMRFTMRVRSPTRHSRSRFGRLASSSAIVGTRAMLQWPRSPRSHPENPRFSAGFVARGGGTIVNIASSVAISPETLNGVYGGSKAFVLALNQSLNHELAGKGVRVQAVLPGATATKF